MSHQYITWKKTALFFRIMVILKNLELLGTLWASVLNNKEKNAVITDVKTLQLYMRNKQTQYTGCNCVNKKTETLNI